MLFTSESVTAGHPDKVCDQISDAVLDDILAHDPRAHVACEVAAANKLILVMGEFATTHSFDVAEIVRRTLERIGYDPEQFEGLSCVNIQSPDIAQGVNQSIEARLGSDDPLDADGAGDQGMMFGYACNETASYMPLPIDLAHKLTRRLSECGLPYLKPDGKAQVTVQYRDGKPEQVTNVLVSCQHEAGIEHAQIAGDIREQVIEPVIPDLSRAEVLVNPTGSFVKGGPEADSGLTGRKIIVDTYGGMARHGGGAFSGKDPSKVDRSASYYARYVAKNIVAQGLADRLELQVAYAIGRAKPVSLNVQTFGTGDEAHIYKVLANEYDFRPAAIIQELDLLRPIYEQTAAYGHFGRDEFPWERLI